MIVLSKTLKIEQQQRHAAELRAIEAERRADEAQAALRKLEAETLVCSFCGKNSKTVHKLIAGPRVFICNECVDLCVDILAEEAK